MTNYRQCDMNRDCKRPSIYLGAKGYLYCAEHRGDRRGWEATRPLKNWEIRRIEEGKLLVGWNTTWKQTEEYDLNMKEAS